MAMCLKEPVWKKKFTKAMSGGIMEAGRSHGHLINRPIEQRSSHRGHPGAILHFGSSLNRRQMILLAQLPEFDSHVVVAKKDVNMKDLAALTAKTGVEFAMFTRRNERLVIRGNSAMTNVTENYAAKLATQGYRWSGHTHPGNGHNVLLASEGDLAILKLFRQERSCIWNQFGEYRIFDKED